MRDTPFAVIRWSELSPTITAGEAGTVTERVAEVGGLRTRLVDFSTVLGGDRRNGLYRRSDGLAPLVSRLRSHVNDYAGRPSE